MRERETLLNSGLVSETLTSAHGSAAPLLSSFDQEFHLMHYSYKSIKPVDMCNGASTIEFFTTRGSPVRLTVYFRMIFRVTNDLSDAFQGWRTSIGALNALSHLSINM